MEPSSAIVGTDVYTVTPYLRSAVSMISSPAAVAIAAASAASVLLYVAIDAAVLLGGIPGTTLLLPPGFSEKAWGHRLPADVGTNDGTTFLLTPCYA
eukprot:7981052-Pyramimonas_sp.AAC.1